MRWLIPLALVAGCAGAGTAAPGRTAPPATLALDGPATARIAQEDVRPIEIIEHPRTGAPLVLP